MKSHVDACPARQANLERGGGGIKHAPAHLAGKDDRLVSAAPLLELVGDWKGFLAGGLAAAELEAIRAHERTGRPLGSEAFLEGLEARLGRAIRKRKAGRKPKQESE